MRLSLINVEKWLAGLADATLSHCFLGRVQEENPTKSLVGIAAVVSTFDLALKVQKICQCRCRTVVVEFTNDFNDFAFARRPICTPADGRCPRSSHARRSGTVKPQRGFFHHNAKYDNLGGVVCGMCVSCVGHGTAAKAAQE